MRKVSILITVVLIFISGCNFFKKETKDELNATLISI